jgi:hypothetical protein
MISIVELGVWFVINILIVFGIAHFKTTWLYTVRYISIQVTLFIVGIILIIWIDLHENWILIMGIVITLWSFFSILSWPKTQPKIMKILKLRW